MRSKKLHKQPFEPCYVIHQQPYLERKLRLSLLCQSHGLVHAIANKPSRKKGPIQLFTPMSAQLSMGKQLATVHAIEPTGYLPMLTGKALLAGMYFNELIYRLCSPHNDGAPLFELYQSHLANILQPQQRQQHIRQFEYRLQTLLGFALDYTCLESTAVWFHYDPAHGLQPTNAHNPEKIPRNYVEKLAQQDWDDPVAGQTSKHIFAKVIHNLLGAHALAITHLLQKPGSTTPLQS